MTGTRPRPGVGTEATGNGLDGQGQGIAPLTSVNGVACVAATDLPEQLYRWAVERGADTALSTGALVTVVGMHGDRLLVCDYVCCLDSPRALVVVPDVLVAEGVANGHDVPAAVTLARADGRSVLVFAGRPA